MQHTAVLSPPGCSLSHSTTQAQVPIPIPNTPLKVPAAQILLEATPIWNPSPNPSAAIQLQDLTVYPTHRDKVSPDSATNLLCDFGQVT